MRTTATTLDRTTTLPSTLDRTTTLPSTLDRTTTLSTTTTLKHALQRAALANGPHLHAAAPVAAGQMGVVAYVSCLMLQ